MHTPLPTPAPPPPQPPAIYEVGSEADEILRTGKNRGIWQLCPCPTRLLDIGCTSWASEEALPGPSQALPLLLGFLCSCLLWSKGSEGSLQLRDV